MSMDKAKHNPHPYEGDGKGPCEKCGLSKGFSVHGDMDKIAEKIAEREDKGDRPTARGRREEDQPIPAGEGARVSNIRMKDKSA